MPGGRKPRIIRGMRALLWVAVGLVGCGTDSGDGLFSRLPDRDAGADAASSGGAGGSGGTSAASGGVTSSGGLTGSGPVSECWGRTCDPQADAPGCCAGYECMVDIFGKGRCQQWCGDTSQCPADWECVTMGYSCNPYVQMPVGSCEPSRLARFCSPACAVQDDCPNGCCLVFFYPDPSTGQAPNRSAMCPPPNERKRQCVFNGSWCNPDPNCP